MRLLDRYPTMRAVVVNTRSGQGFRGVLWRKRRGYLVLRNAEMLRPGAEAVGVDGEVLIPAENVEFIQVVS